MDEVIENLYKYEKAPPSLELDTEEKFKYTAGNTINIEVRGERAHNKWQFRVEYVSIGFEMPSLCKHIQDKNTNFEKNRLSTFHC